MTVLDRRFGSIGAVEDAERDEMKQLAAVPKLLREGVFFVFAVRLEAAANIRNADLLNAFRGGEEDFRGSVCHEHDSLWIGLQLGIGRARYVYVNRMFQYLPDRYDKRAGAGDQRSDDLKQ